MLTPSALRAHAMGDVVIGFSQGHAGGGIDVPAELLGARPDQLFVVDGNLVDGRPLVSFFIDAGGGKHAAQLDASWQPLACRIADRVVKGPDGKWQVKA